MKPYQFSHHENVPKQPPKVAAWNLLISGKKLSREEKDKIFEMSRNNKGWYKLAGWSFPFYSFMNRYLVNYRFDSNFVVIYAPDATCIRTNTYSKIGGINEIIKANKK